MNNLFYTNCQHTAFYVLTNNFYIISAPYDIHMFKVKLISKKTPCIIQANMKILKTMVNLAYETENGAVQ